MRDGNRQNDGRGGARPKPPGIRRPPSPKRSPAEILALRIAELQRTAGLPAALARVVAAGRVDLNEVLTRLARVDEVARLMSVHKLDKALASQVAMGLVDLERVLSRRRMAAHIAEFRERDALVEAIGAGEQVLGLHGREVFRGRVTEVRPYEVVVVDTAGGDERVIHKTAVKFLATAEAWQKARKAMTWDAERKRAEVQPILRPQDRFGCSNTRLGEAWVGAVPVRLTLLEGEVFVGKVSWVARWDFGLATRGATVVILRHALANFGDET